MPENITQEVRTESFICPTCGASLRHDMKKDKFLCAACGYEAALHAGDNTVDELDFDDYAKREAQSVPFVGLSMATCKNCGNQITFDKTTAATTCPMCGSTQILQTEQQTGIPPEGIIPFRVNRSEAERKFQEWVKGLWFAPNKLKSVHQSGNLAGMFVPFWTFDANVFATYKGEGGRYRTVKDSEGKEHTETDWYPAVGVVQRSFDDLLVVAAEGEGAQNAQHVAPFDTVHELRPYAPEYLSGYQAEFYSVKADVAFESAKSEMEGKMHTLADDDVRTKFDTSRNVHVFPRYTDVTYKHVLLPVWSSVFGYGGKTYHYVVNGASGEVYGDRPFSKAKIAIAIAMTLLVLVGGAALFLGGGESSSDYEETDQVEVVQTGMELPSQQAYNELAAPVEL